MKKNTFIYIALWMLLIVILSYMFKANQLEQTTSNQGSSEAKKLQVVTSFYPLYYFASQIAGDKAIIKNITPPGVEPHDYDPSTQDVAQIEKSNMLILNGNVESWGDKIQNNLKGTDVTIVTAGAGLFTRLDPHVWLDPVKASQEAHAIELGFEKIDPTNSLYYQRNEKSLDDHLNQLDTTYKTGLADCIQKNIVTSHAAFGYLATRYNLRQVPVAGLSPDAEPSAQQLVNVIKFAKTNNVKYIFFERLVSPKLSETIATEIGAKTLVLDPIEGITDDDMRAGKNYYTIMLENLKNIQTALQCKT